MGALFSREHAAAVAAHAALVDQARPALFPPFARGTADTLGQFDFYEATFTKLDYGACVANLHALCVDADPELGSFLRSRVIADRVGAVAADAATVRGVARAQAAADAIAEYECAIARHLAGLPAAEPHASALVAAHALRARIAECMARHVEHAAEAFARVERERRDAEAAIVSAERVEREELARFFEGRSSLPHVVGASVFQGSALAAAARRAGSRDHDGEYRSLTLAQLEAARAAAQR
ncbi:MAG: hypothetical protein ABI818_10305 [Acidobacteriota bacterium]